MPGGDRLEPIGCWFSPPWNASSSTEERSRHRPKRARRSSSTSKDGITRIVVTLGSITDPRSTSRGATNRLLEPKRLPVHGSGATPAQHSAHHFRAARKQEAQRIRKAQQPLAHPLLGKHLVRPRRPRPPRSSTPRRFDASRRSCACFVACAAWKPSLEKPAFLIGCMAMYW